MPKRRFEFDDGKSRKFWEIQLKGTSHIVCYGRLGTDGRTVEKAFDTRDKAKAAHDKLIEQKTGKGYSEIGRSTTKKSIKKKSKVTKKKVTKKTVAKKKGTKKAAKKVAMLRWPKGHSHAEWPWEPRGFPPRLGYSTLHTDVFGDADETGFYWPIGQEKQMPLVVRKFHDTGELGPFFSSLQRYERWSRTQDDESLPYGPDAAIDPDSPEALYVRGRELLKAKDVPAALDVLERCLERLPEFTLVSSLLAKEHRRAKSLDQALLFALQSLISPHMFGQFDQSLLKWAGRQTSPPDAFADNPIWSQRKKLKWAFRQKKNDYEIMQEAIDGFFEAGQSVLGLTLMQTYAEFIDWEPDSTKRRLKFDLEEWTDRQDEMCMKYLKVSRRPGGQRS